MRLCGAYTSPVPLRAFLERHTKSSSLKTGSNTYMHEQQNSRLRFLNTGRNQLPRTEYYFLATISFILFMNMPLNTDGSILNKNLKSSLISI